MRCVASHTQELAFRKQQRQAEERERELESGRPGKGKGKGAFSSSTGSLKRKSRGAGAGSAAGRKGTHASTMGGSLRSRREGGKNKPRRRKVNARSLTKDRGGE